jgi:hypothetical protein
MSNGYIGVAPVPRASVVITQGTFSVPSDNIVVGGGYNVGNVVVYVNGVRLRSSDYTATDGINIVFNEQWEAGDEYLVEEYRNFEKANHPTYNELASETGATLVGVDLSEFDSEASNTQEALTEVYSDIASLKNEVQIDIPVGSIGQAGWVGFGVGVYPDTDLLAKGLTPIFGHDNPYSDSYGNYQHDNGSIMCFIPKFYYRIGNAAAEHYDRFGANTLEVVGSETYASESEANTDGFILHRAFIDGGVEKDGFFVDKYVNSKSASDANVAVSVKNGVPISLTTDTSYTISQGMTGCTGILADSIVLARARGTGYNVTTLFMYSALAMLSLAHGQYAESSKFCAWFDPTGVTNFPKGCNDDNLRDVNDPSVVFVSAGDSATASKPLAGSGVPFDRTSHNGQNCGVVDLNGTMWETSLGITMGGSSATDSGAVANNTLYVLKESESFANLTSGWNGATDAFATTANLASKYDAFTTDIPLSSLGGWISWGNGATPVFYSNQNGVERAVCGVIPPNAGLSASGINMLGQDGVYRYTRENLFVRSGGTWSHGGSSGVFARSFNYWRSYARNDSSFRAATF